MYPRRYARGRRYSSGSRSATWRLLLIAAAACVPVLIIAYAVTATHAGRAVDTADVTGTGLHPSYGDTARAGGWGKGGYTMMPGPAGSSSAESGVARNAVTAAAVTSQTSDTAQLGSAEIIAEAPSDGNGDVLPLSDFGAVTFTDALIDTDPIGSLNTAEVTMESAGGVAEATPSALTDGDEFTVTVDNTSTTGTAGTTGTTGSTGTTGTTGGHRHRHHHPGSAG